MSEHLNNHVPRPEAAQEPAVSTRTGLLRAAADDELSAAQRAELNRHLAAHPEDRLVIEFERGLRQSVAGAGVSEAAPSRLRERILALRQGGEDRSRIPLAPASQARRGSPWVIGWLAVAASVAIVVAGALVAVRHAGFVRPDGVVIDPSLRASLVSFIRSQHDECEVHADMIGRRFKTTRLDDVPAEFARVLGTAPDISCLRLPEFRLLGAGPCAVPGRGKSVRLVLECTADRVGAGERGPLVSIHIQQDTGEIDLEPGRTYRLTDPRPTADVPSEILVCRRDGFIYFLTSRSQPAMQMARAALGAPEPSGML
jgi:hypothetical protein